MGNILSNVFKAVVIIAIIAAIVVAFNFADGILESKRVSFDIETRTQLDLPDTSSLLDMTAHSKKAEYELIEFEPMYFVVAVSKN